MYLKTKEHLGLYTSTQFNDGLDVTKCILNENVVKQEVPALEVEHSAHDRKVWEYKMGELMKMERVLWGNLCNLLAVDVTM